MDNKELEELNKLVEKSSKDFYESQKALKDILKNHKKIKLPKGFDFNISFIYDLDINLNKKEGFTILDENVKLVDKLEINIIETDREPNNLKTKYFNYLESKINLNFNNSNLVGFKKDYFDDGFNKNEYQDLKNKEIPKEKLIKIIEAVEDVQEAILEISKNTPEDLTKELLKSKSAHNLYINLSSKVRVEKESRKNQKRQDDINAISECFKPSGNKTITRIKNQLINSTEKNPTITGVSFIIDKNETFDMTAKNITISCIKGRKPRFTIKIGEKNESLMDSSKLDETLSQFLVFDGNKLKHTDEILKILSNEKITKRNNKENNPNSISLNIDDFSQSAKKILSERKIVSKNKNTKNRL